MGLGISDFCNHGHDYDCSMSVKLSLAYIYNNIIMGAVGMSTQSKAGICSNDEHNNIIWVQYGEQQVKLATWGIYSDEKHLQPEIGLCSSEDQHLQLEQFYIIKIRVYS